MAFKPYSNKQNPTLVKIYSTKTNVHGLMARHEQKLLLDFNSD